MLGEVALPQTQSLDQLAHRARPVTKLVDDQKAGRVGEGFTEMRMELVELLLRLLSAH
jgi:hypothetical protein